MALVFMRIAPNWRWLVMAPLPRSRKKRLHQMPASWRLI